MDRPQKQQRVIDEDEVLFSSEESGEGGNGVPPFPPIPSSNVSGFGGGGNACTLKSLKIGRPDQIIRITSSPNALNDIESYKRLQRVLHWGMLKLIEEPVQLRFVDMPQKVITAIMKNEKCSAAMRSKWNVENPVLTMSRMEFASEGILGNVAPAEMPRMIFLLLGLLYAAQYQTHFEHGDLTAWNVVIKDDLPRIIDMDFVRFDPESTNPARGLGSLHIRPLEWTSRFSTPDQRKVLGAADVWALGIFLYSKMVLPDYAGGFNVPRILFDQYKNVIDVVDLEGPTHDITCCFHALLFDKPIDNYALFQRVNNQDVNPANAFRTQMFGKLSNRFKAKIDAIPVPTRAILKKMLALNPIERVQFFSMNKYFDMAYFDGLDKISLINNYIRPLFPANLQTWPKTTDKPAAELVKSLVSIGAPLVCTTCTKRAGTYVDNLKNSISCGHEACL